MASVAAGGRGQRDFAVHDPLFNTNTVDVAYRVAFHADLPTGLLLAAPDDAMALTDRLNDPAYGGPNLVVAGPATSIPAAASYAPQSGLRLVTTVLRADGFTPVDSVLLPDGRPMTLWWHPDRGPAIPSRPVL